MSEKVHTFRSAVDSRLMICLYAGPAALLVVAAYAMQQGRGDIAGTSLIVFAGLVLLNWLLTWPCRYTLTEDALNVRCGLYFRSIPLDRIADITPTSSWANGPALSLRRVRIDVAGGRSCLVSPVDRDAFMEEVRAAAARLRAAEQPPELQESSIG